MARIKASQGSIGMFSLSPLDLGMQAKGRWALRHTSVAKKIGKPHVLPLSSVRWIGLSDIVAEVLQIVANGNHELVSVCAVNDAMVVSQHQPQDMADGDGVISILIRNHRGLLED